VRQIEIAIPVDQITDWPSFHDVFQRTLGFPNFYGRNMDAWIDCMTSVDTPADGLTTVTVPPGEVLVLRIDDPSSSRGGAPNNTMRCSNARRS
jgi:hypothetical protein